MAAGNGGRNLTPDQVLELCERLENLNIQILTHLTRAESATERMGTLGMSQDFVNGYYAAVIAGTAACLQGYHRELSQLTDECRIVFGEMTL